MGQGCALVKGARLGDPAGGRVVCWGDPTASSEEDETRLGPPGPPATSPPAGAAFPLPEAWVQAGLGGPGGARGRAPRPHFSCRPPSLPGSPGGRANERREEGAGSGALGTALPRRPGRSANAKFAPG